jgi:CheY-like chemotaxis protein
MSAPILLVEDNADEVYLLERALQRGGVTAPFAVVHDGRAAVDYLAGTSPYEDRIRHPLPQLILLDLKLPGLSGIDVLKWLRGQEGLRRLPVVVLTSSTEERDVERAYDAGANSYLVKPMDLAALEHLGLLLQQYWLGANVTARIAKA